MIVLTDYVTCVYVIYPNNQWGIVIFSVAETTCVDVTTPIAFRRLIFVDLVDYEVGNSERLYAQDILGYVKDFQSTTQIRILRNKGLAGGNAYEWMGLFAV